MFPDVGIKTSGRLLLFCQLRMSKRNRIKHIEIMITTTYVWYWRANARAHKMEHTIQLGTTQANQMDNATHAISIMFVS